MLIILTKQILRVDHETYVAQFIRFTINTSEEIGKIRNSSMFKPVTRMTTRFLPEKENNQDSDALEAKNAKHDFGNVKLGTPTKQTTVRDLLSLVSGQARFVGFKEKLSLFLTEMLKSSSLSPDMLTIHGQTKVGNHDDWISLLAAESAVQITPFGFLKVSYESCVTWRTCTDYIRCNDKLKSPRHDCVMIQTTEGIIFVKLIFVFTIRIAQTDYPLALVEPYDFQQPEGQALQNKDADMQFLRLRTTGASEFISVNSIIRGAVLVPAYDIDTDYMVFDLLDSDMVLRIRKLLQLLEAADQNHL